MYSGHIAGGCVGHQGLTGRAGLLVSLVVLALLAAAPVARGATFGIAPDGFQVRMLDAEGHPESRSGSHPDLLQVDFALELDGTAPRALEFDLPAGFGGSSRAVPLCPRQAFDAGEECPAESQVGVSEFGLADGQKTDLPIFQLEPAPGEIVAFGSKANVGVPFTLELRPDDFGVTLSGDNPQQAPLSEGHIELWGVPADHQQGTAIPRRALLTAPSRCGPAEFTLRTRSWQEGAPWLSASTEIGPLEGCEDLEFDPRLGLSLDNPLADSPTGLRMEVSMPPEAEDAAGLAGAQLRAATIELPAGLAISPAGAGQLTPCTDAQFGPENTDPALCPPASAVGSVELSSPVLGEPLEGTLYIGEERPEERFRVLVAVPAPGTVLKFAAALRPDPATGRLAATLEDVPQMAIDRLSLSLNGGAQALLTSPLACGPAVARGRFAPHGGGAQVESTTSVQIAPRSTAWACPGPGPFEPRLLAQSSDPRAGHLTTFAATLSREDGEQVPRRFSILLPPGLSASLGAVQSCPDADAAAGRCPDGSRIGRIAAEVGSGPRPVVLPGDMFVTGPYGRAPFGLLIELEAAIGPFDLGVITLRAGADLDGRSGRVKVTVDRLPESIEGVPIRFRAIELALDRRGLVRNPTSCGRKSVDGAIESQGGVSVAVSSELTVRGCSKLGFRPRIRIAVKRPAGRRGASPRLVVSTRSRVGDANMRSLRVSFPPLFKFQVGGLKEICSRPDAAAGACPAGSRVGSVTARTPLLNDPLEGAVYIVQPSDNGEPELGLSLAADRVSFDLRGHTSSRKGHFVTNLAELPDLALSSMTMRLGGEGNEAFSFAGGPCAKGKRKRPLAAIRAEGQNGARWVSRQPIAARARCHPARERAVAR
jgi:hypothetical protein